MFRTFQFGRYLLAGLITLVSVPAEADLIVNGDFSAGATGFSSDYTLVPGGAGGFTLPGDIGITSDPSNGSSSGFTNSYLSFGDHTTGSGQMLLVDGDGSSLDIWRESVSLAADTTYTFSYYATSPDGDTLSGSNIADLEILVNGTAQSDTLITSQGGSPSWQLVSTDFKTGAAGSYAFSIKDLNSAAYDNDVAIDDIQLVAPEPASWALIVPGLGFVGAVLRRRRQSV